MKKYSLELIVFLCGLAVMVLELVGSRILAPYLGTSLFTWTSLIGIILASLSIGYWYGGKLADKNPRFSSLSFIIFLAAILVGLVAFFQDKVLYLITRSVQDIRFSSIVATTILFAFPSIFLGMVSPYAVRLKINALNQSGRTVGNLYAWSTIGSIVGTFLAGFFLIPFFGSTRILFFLSILLILVSLITYGSGFLKLKIAVLILLAFIFASTYYFQGIRQKQGLIDLDSFYYRIQVYPGVDKTTNRPIRNLKTDAQANQSAMFLDQDNDLVFEYTKYYRLVKYFNPNFQDTLMIGAGAYSYPKDYLQKFPNALIDVVEIDPKMTEISHKYFNLKNDPRLQIYHQDGRIFLNKNQKKYDAIFVDAFKSFSPPYQLTTKEAITKISDSLNNNGVVIANVVSALEGKKSFFLRAEYKIFREIFPQVYLLPVQSQESSVVQNIILIALRTDQKFDFESEDWQLNYYLSRRWQKELEDNVPVLTDDHAPVDYYVMKSI